jgi:hypothetical protein
LIEIGSHDEVGCRDFASRAVRDADDGGFGDARLLLKELLYLARIDVEAAGDDQVALAALERIVAVVRK